MIDQEERMKNKNYRSLKMFPSDIILKEPVKSFVGMFRKMKISLYDN